MSLYKDFQFEKLKVSFQAQALNAFNTPEFSAPVTKFGNATFGQVQSQANYPRFLQLGPEFHSRVYNLRYALPRSSGIGAPPILAFGSSFNGVRKDMSSFWKTPRNTAFRKLVFEIHFYAGLVAGLLWTVVGLTGSAIVFVPDLRRLEVPGWTRVEPAAHAMPLETLAHRILAARPADHIHNIYFDFKPDWGCNFWTVPPNGDRVQTFIDQYRGTLLGSFNYNHSALQYHLRDLVCAGHLDLATHSGRLQETGLKPTRSTSTRIAPL